MKLKLLLVPMNQSVKKGLGRKEENEDDCLKSGLQVHPKNNYFKSGEIKFNTLQLEHVLFISKYCF